MGHNMSRDIFRHDSIERLSSPKQLNRLLVVIRLKGWVVLWTLCTLLLGVVVWSIFGQIPIITTGQGILLAPSAQFAIKSPVQAIIKDIPVPINQFVPQGTVLMELSGGVDIETYHDGKIFQFETSVGEQVQVGQPLLWFETAIHPTDLLVYGFIPVEAGEKIKPGMIARIDLNAVDTQKYGQLVGSVISVVPYAVSSNSDQLNVIPSEKLREDLTKGSTAMLVIIQPTLYPKNMTGLRWTSSKGPPDKLLPGSLGVVRVTIENKRPISYLIPGLGD